MTTADFLDPPRRGQRALGGAAVWLGAAAAAIAAHALVVALGLRQPPAPAEGGAPPAVLLELAPAPAAPPAEIDDVALDMADAPDAPPPPLPSPELAAARLPPPEPPAPLPTPQAAELPPPVPAPPPVAPVAPPPPDPVAVPDPAPRPVARPRELPRVAPPPELEPEPPSESQTQARSRQPAPAAAPVAPQASRGVASRAEQAEWQSLLLAHLERAKRYPSSARARGQEGVAQIRFAIDTGGGVLGAELVASSGIAALDEEAVGLVLRASPVPAPPPGSPRDFTVPVQFTLR